MSSRFDNLAISYDEELKESLGNFGARNIEMFAGYKIKILQRICCRKLKNSVPVNILEFGCGTGRNNFFMTGIFPNSKIFGCDLSEKSLKIAMAENPSVKYDKIVATEDLLRVYDTPFDCIFISNVFHHIPFKEHQSWLDVLHKILASDGIIVIFEHNPFNPLTRHIFKNSVIDKDAIMLKPSYCLSLLKNTGFSKAVLNYTLFFPWRNAFLEAIERVLYFLPLGAQYYIWGKK